MDFAGSVGERVGRQPRALSAMDSPSAPPSLPTFEQESVQGSFFLSLVITTIGTPFLIIAFLLLSRFVENCANQCTPQLTQLNSWAWHLWS